jgi:hypothetical protein
MNEVSQINAAGSAVLGSLLYSDGAVPSAPIRIPSPVQGQSVEVLLKQAFFNPIDVGATLAFMEEAGLEPLPEEDAEVSDISTEESSEESSEKESSGEDIPDKRSQHRAACCVVDFVELDLNCIPYPNSIHSAHSFFSSLTSSPALIASCFLLAARSLFLSRSFSNFLAELKTPFVPDPQAAQLGSFPISFQCACLTEVMATSCDDWFHVRSLANNTSKRYVL